MSGLMNPDCRDGKHHACYGDGWDLERDESAPCACNCHTQEPLDVALCPACEGAGTIEVELALTRCTACGGTGDTMEGLPIINTTPPTEDENNA